MNISSNLKIMAMAALMIAAGSQADARRPHRPHGRQPSCAVIVRAPKHQHVVNRRVCNLFSRQERLEMALAYLSHNPRLSVKQYAKMTSLNKKAAEAELDAFALDRRIPIRCVVEGKKKFYVLRRACS